MNQRQQLQFVLQITTENPTQCGGLFCQSYTYYLFRLRA